MLGRGGVGAVYAATHRNGNQVAIKILHRALSQIDEVRERFLREGYVANAVGHPGVVRILDDDVTEGGTAFLVMELLNGESLEDRRARMGGRVPLGDVLAIGHHVLDVLAAAHDKGIIHRDIKPENVFLVDDGTIRLLDFGVARVLQTMGTRTATGVLLGTPGFMAPEQVSGERGAVDARADVWAVGSMLFTLLSGESVHPCGDNVVEALCVTATVPARSLAAVTHDVPGNVIAIVDRALAFDRDDRWPSARAMQQALAEASDALGQLATAETAAAPTVPLRNASKGWDDGQTEVLSAPPVHLGAMDSSGEWATRAALAADEERARAGISHTALVAAPRAPERAAASFARSSPPPRASTTPSRSSPPPRASASRGYPPVLAPSRPAMAPPPAAAVSSAAPIAPVTPSQLSAPPLEASSRLVRTDPPARPRSATSVLWPLLAIGFGGLVIVVAVLAWLWRTRALPAFFAGALIALTPAIARAQPDDHDRMAARDLFFDGVRLEEGAKYAAALDRFERAERLHSAPTHLVHIATCLASLGKLVQAAETYRALAKATLPAGAPPAFVQAQARAAAELPEIVARIPSLTIEVTPAGAPRLEIELDGAPLNSAFVGAARPTDPGTHTLKVRAQGYASQEMTVTLGERQVRTASFVLQAVSSPAVSAAQPAPRARAAGRRVLWEGWIATGALAAGGAVTGVLALGSAADLRSARGRLGVSQSELDRDASRTRALSIASDVCMAGAAVAGGLTLYFSLRPSKRDAAAWLEIDPRGASVAGRF